MANFPELVVEVDDGLRHGLEGVETLFQGLGVVVLSLNRRTGSTAQATSHQGRFVHIVEEDILALTDILFEVDGLINSSREAIDEVVLGGPRNEAVDQDLNRQFKRHEPPISHYLSDPLAVLRPLLQREMMMWEISTNLPFLSLRA